MIWQEQGNYDCFPKASKSFLIIKREYKQFVEQIVRGSKTKITAEGARSLGAILGELNFKNEYIHNKVQSWRDQLEVLSKIA